MRTLPDRKVDVASHPHQMRSPARALSTARRQTRQRLILVSVETFALELLNAVSMIANWADSARPTHALLKEEQSPYRWRPGRIGH